MCPPVCDASTGGLPGSLSYGQVFLGNGPYGCSSSNLGMVQVVPVAWGLPLMGGAREGLRMQELWMMPLVRGLSLGSSCQRAGRSSPALAAARPCTVELSTIQGGPLRLEESRRRPLQSSPFLVHRSLTHEHAENTREGPKERAAS